VADLLRPQKLAGGFGLIRIAANLSVTIGPAIGGLLAARSYTLLFVFDAISSTITAFVVFLFLRETKPRLRKDQPQETMVETIAGYSRVLRNSAFVLFMLASIMMATVYSQMNTTLAPYLRDQHGVTEQGFGFIMTLNAAMVVLLQLWITRRMSGYRPMTMMALGTLLYGAGFAMFGLAPTYPLFLAAMAVITIGEMVSVPVAQVLVADFAPEDMRARYMAAYGFTWTIAFALGPMLGGLMLDNYNPHWLWYATGLLGLLTAGIFMLLERGDRVEPAAVEEPV
jgi:predicted MFS family arabinose efflux permease